MNRIKNYYHNFVLSIIKVLVLSYRMCTPVKGAAVPDLTVFKYSFIIIIITLLCQSASPTGACRCVCVCMCLTCVSSIWGSVCATVLSSTSSTVHNVDFFLHDKLVYYLLG